MAREQVGVLWGKSSAGDASMHLLVGHLLDTAAVAELLWDRWLAPSTRDVLDACSAGQGRSLVSLVCGLHDVGKATPAFQMKVPDLARAVVDSGLSMTGVTRNDSGRWHHTLAGAAVLRSALGVGPSFRWLWPLIAGHHGIIDDADRRLGMTPPAHGDAAWQAVQQEVVRFVCTALVVDLEVLRGATPPRRAVQFAMCGAIVMADWIASNDACGPGLSDLASITMQGARSRAQGAWTALGLRGGWAGTALVDDDHMMRRRFGRDARPLQALTVRAARLMPVPGLMVVEAPMGEGKTEAALLAAEVLAARHGANGVFVGMPTQATGDAMFARVRDWSVSIDPDVPLGLLHGRRAFNREWMALRRATAFAGICDDESVGHRDAYGVSGPYGAGAEDDSSPTPEPAVEGTRPSEWFLGRKRGLLVPITVGTVDQLLMAATRTRHVMLRHLGLIGRVVVIDEVHAYDIYMSQFLHEELRWLGEAGVPVVLLSATLPPAQREHLLRAYAWGATGVRDAPVPAPVEVGYPSITTLVPDGETAVVRNVTCPPRRDSVDVQLEVLTEDEEFSPAAIAESIHGRLAAGGCALVVVNTVVRAQQTYQALKQAFGADVVLLHSRLTVAERGRRTEQLLAELGPPDPGRTRPHRRIVVATQLAEQSFDVDVDLMVTDLAPIDLMLQRIGRLHRHDRTEPRPERVRRPVAIVSGLRLRGTLPPEVPRGSEYVYGLHTLLRSAALVEAAGHVPWSIPAEVPELVRRGYDEAASTPTGWERTAERARAAQDDENASRAKLAGPFLLGAGGGDPTSLVGLQARGVKAEGEAQYAVVRDGDPSAEVILVRRRSDGRYLTLAGRDLGPSGAAISDPEVLEEVAGSLVRLPPGAPLAAAAEGLGALPGWVHEPWLRDAHVVVLDESWSASLSVGLGRTTITYDVELGLTTTREFG